MGFTTKNSSAFVFSPLTTFLVCLKGFTTPSAFCLLPSAPLLLQFFLATEQTYPIAEKAMVR